METQENGKKDVELILAMDGFDRSGYMTWARFMDRRLAWNKVNDGLDDPGPEVMGWLKQEGSGVRVFGDAKLYDTHDTIGNRVRKLVARGADSISICAFMPLKSMKAAVAAVPSRLVTVFGLDRTQYQAEIWAVGIPSSITPKEWEEENPGQSFIETQQNCFRKAVAAGCRGIICAPSDLPLLDEVLAATGMWDKMDVVVPGTRSSGADKGQQARVLTPAEAKAMGATKLVIGSQVTKHADPLGELARIYEELGQVMPGGPLPEHRRRPSVAPPPAL